MADREDLGETTDRSEIGAALDPSEGNATFQSPRPPILSRERAPGRAENALDALNRDRFPDIIQRAKDFYARHPTLVKVVGTVAVAALARRLFRGRPGLF